MSEAASSVRGDSDEINACFAVDGVHGEVGVFKGAGGEIQGSLELKETSEGRRGGFDDNISGSS